MTEELTQTERAALQLVGEKVEEIERLQNELHDAYKLVSQLQALFYQALALIEDDIMRRQARIESEEAE